MSQKIFWHHRCRGSKKNLIEKIRLGHEKKNLNILIRAQKRCVQKQKQKIYIKILYRKKALLLEMWSKKSAYP